MKAIIITKPDKEKLFNHLLQDPNQENMAVTLCGHSSFEQQQQFLVKDMLLIDDVGLDVHTRSGLALKEDVYRKILLKSDETNTSLLFWHSHPFAETAWFSSIDNNNDLEHAKFLRKHLPKTYYGNVVVAQKDYKARLFNKHKRIFEEIQEIVTFGHPKLAIDFANEAELERNYRAFGREGQSIISKSKVALIGCGGLGWHIAQQLIGIGVRSLLLVDPDILEITNLNRMPGAPFSKVGSPKVRVLSNLLKKMNPKTEVRYMIASIFDSRVMKRLRKYDVIIGAVDSDGPRSELNRFAVRCLKYYLDAGTGILLEDGKVKHAGGQVNVVIPGISPCLACNHTLDWKLILYESLEKGEQEIEVKRGYIQGVSEPGPSVVSINGVIASTLVNEFITLATGLKKPYYYTYFDYMATDSLMFRVDVQKNDNCIICSREALFGYGDIVKESKNSGKLPTFI